jgi:hypothetical protein
MAKVRYLYSPLSPPSDEPYAAVESRCFLRGRICNLELVVLQGLPAGDGPPRRGRPEGPQSLHRSSGAIPFFVVECGYSK